MGRIEIIRDFQDPADGSARVLRIFTPEVYHRDLSTRLPVLYMHDGQNVFAHPESARPETWCANVAMDQLERHGQLEPWIIVAVDHPRDRFGEYTPWDYPAARVRARADRYVRFLIRTLKPWVDAHYHTRPEAQWTATMGSSLGGLISLYLGLAHGDVFGRVGALSPTVMWSDSEIYRRWSSHGRRWTRIYLDAGAHEQLLLDGIHLDYGTHARRFFTHLKRLGYDDHEVCLVLEPGGQHSERDWARRLPFAFRWLLC
ncbi:MAG TPA: alpha/beta hydrolase-fold protein [Myxococcales bacterium]|nr:alpha/beta hydrolase-fold protein [Myxococcales bacterium]